MDHDPVIVQVELSEQHAWAFAQLLKRLGYSDCRALAEDEPQVWLMLQAAEYVRRALAQAGVAPR
jgi:hypothetical protein